MLSMTGNIDKKLAALLFGLVFIAWPTFAISDEIDVDTIITIIKQEIQTASAMESGSPRIQINRVEIGLSVITEQRQGENLKLKVPIYTGGLKKEIPGSRTQRLNLVIIPTGNEIAMSPESSTGFAEVIQKFKEALRKAYHNPPAFNFESFSYSIEFVVASDREGNIIFIINDLVDIKAAYLPVHRVKVYLSIDK